MKTVKFIISIFIVSTIQGQDNWSISQTDSIITTIDSNQRNVKKFRWVLGYINYQAVDDKIDKITYSYKAGPKQITESFYIKDTCLFFASKQVYLYYLYGDGLVLLGQYYFDNKNLRCYNLYHDEEEIGIASTQKLVMEEYYKVRSIISRINKKYND